MRHILAASAALLALAALSSCAPAVFAGASAVGGNTFTQERKAETTMDDIGTDLGIERRLLQRDPDLYGRIDVEVVEGRVLLTGSVPDQENAIEAVRIAWTVPGVTEVINELQVSQERNWKNRTQDFWIKSQISTRMLLEKGLKSQNYNIEVMNGTVYLMGIAQNEAELAKATAVASTTQYVRQVISHVRMKDDPRRFEDQSAAQGAM